MKYLQINSNASRLSWRMEGGRVAQNLESGTTKDHFSSHFGAEDFNVIVFLIIRTICIKLVERKISHKNKEMLNYALACSCF